MKKLLTILAAAAISCFCLNATALAGEAVIGYQNGDYFWQYEVNTPGYWEYNEETGEETFVRVEEWGEPYAVITGVSYDPDEVEEPFLDIPSAIVDPEEGELPVKTIGCGAFYYRSDIVGAFIPASVDEIEEYAFAGCSSLETLEFEDPEVVEVDVEGESYFDHAIYVDRYAFENCDALDYVEFPANLGCIDEYAFRGCDALESVVFTSGGEDVLECDYDIEQFAFAGCSSLQSVEFQDWEPYEEYDEEEGETITESRAWIVIGDYAFKDCFALADLYLGEGVGYICASAFERAIALASVTFPSTLEYIGSYAFCDCATLEDVDMDACEGKLEYEENAFDGTPWGGNMGVRFMIDGGTLWGCKGLLPAPFEPVDLEIPLEVTEIGYRAFKECEGIASVYVPSTVEYIGDEAFEGCPDLTSVVVEGEDSNIGLGIGCRAFAECQNLESVTFEDRPWDVDVGPTVSETCYWLTGGNYDIGEEAFYNCQNLSSVTFGIGLTWVGDSAFQYCVSLESVDFPWSLSGIDRRAFSDCVSLAEVTFDDNMEEEPEIAEDAFEGTPYAGDVGVRLVIEDNWVVGVKGIIPGSEEPIDIVIPDGVEGIGDEAFCGIDNIASVTIPASVTYIGEYAFDSCDGLEDIYFEAADPFDDDGEFYFEPTLEIGSYAFAYCSALTSLYLPPQTGYVGEGAFQDCDSLEEVWFESDHTVKSGDLEIGEYAFYGCESLTTVVIEDRPYVTEGEDDELEYSCDWGVYIGAGAFADCPALDDLYLGVGVRTIGEWAFEYDEALESVAFPWTLEEIGSRAFGDCESLEEVYFDGDQERVDIAEDAFEGAPVTFVQYWLDIDDEGVLWGCRIKEGAEDLYVEIPDGVVSIAESAFEGANEISGVFIPFSVEYIGPDAFRNCEYLEDVEFEGDIEDVYIEAGAFWNTPFNDDQDFTLTTYDGVVTGFFGWDVPEELEIPDGITAIALSAFDFDCYSIDSVDADNREVMVSPVENIESLYIPESVEEIGQFAFYGCENLTYVEIGNPYVSVDGLAFCECTSLEELTFDNPGMTITAMTLTGYVKCEDCEADADYEEDDEAENSRLAPGESVTIPLDFPALFSWDLYDEYGDVLVTFEWGIVAVADFDPTGSGKTTEVELVLGEPYGEALEGLEPEITRHGQVFAGWLVNGKPLTPDTLVGPDDVITASWKELDYNPLHPEETEEANTAVANIYDGYVLDESGACVGSVQVKVGKENAGSHLATVSASAQLLGQKKLTGFKAKDGGKVNFSNSTLSTQITLVKAGQSNIELYIAKDGLSGVWGNYTIAGGRNTSKASAADYTPWLGVYNVDFATDGASGAGAAFADGFSFVSVSVAAKGKAKVSGVMADGAKVSGSGQLMIGEGGKEACVSVFAPMYAGKTGGFAFVLWIASDGSVSVESVSQWKNTGKTPFTANLEAVAASKLKAPGASLKFRLDANSLPATIGGMSVLGEYLPIEVAAPFAGNKFAVAKANKIKVNRADGKVESVGGTDNDAGLKLTYTAKSGAFKGSFSIYTKSGSKLKKVKVTVNGGIVNGLGYGSAVIKGLGSFPITLE